ncbi:hypothetical protein DX912_17340 [Lysobacter soli]|uniref:HNH domain-containing protein n=1 Tax=Lysobacter soli TaxID=453783 RepID=A0A3D8V7X2_9GAMM|nr:HNH endonuclease [Lysobacter soli]RDY65465.1 hypothetical protein DX912_17340 [Lysobacter soli]
MNVFHYPKARQKRSLKPRQFRRYQTYKPYLQHEFARVCVYCRQPDSSVPNLNFQVDHYRPKSISKFAHLVCSYENLFYCCSACNSRKGAYWPDDETAGPYVVNPCDHEMASHLKFDSATGRMDPKSAYGRHTEELLLLNDEESVAYRRSTLQVLRLLNDAVGERERSLKKISARLKSKRITQADHDSAVADITAELSELRRTIAAYAGTLPLRRLPGMRNGIDLTA